MRRLYLCMFYSVFSTFWCFILKYDLIFPPEVQTVKDEIPPEHKEGENNTNKIKILLHINQTNISNIKTRL